MFTVQQQYFLCLCSLAGDVVKAKFIRAPLAIAPNANEIRVKGKEEKKKEIEICTAWTDCRVPQLD